MASRLRLLRSPASIAFLILSFFQGSVCGITFTFTNRACEAFGSPEYCCNGAYGNPDTCHPSQYSQLFKSACPKSYSYAYDDATSTFTCNHTDYTITFCPKSTPSGGNSKNSPKRPSHEQLEDDVWLASLKSSDAGAPTAASWSATSAFHSALAIAVVITLAVFDHPLLNLL
ncbi:hypothetical protein EJB05_47748 [Eragrostis curvula]|uniref:X8 domain-containing protein n=1 Tax=Eragrostis curvula TaxID=38414 RepID=A0A5J9T061_9POAL|nr:hypothetical protein EJB05_47748 [Eragrostis curvula]